MAKPTLATLAPPKGMINDPPLSFLQALLRELVDERLARMDNAERVNEAFAQWLLQGVEAAIAGSCCCALSTHNTYSPGAHRRRKQGPRPRTRLCK